MAVHIIVVNIESNSGLLPFLTIPTTTFNFHDNNIYRYNESGSTGNMKLLVRLRCISKLFLKLQYVGFNDI